MAVSSSAYTDRQLGHRLVQMGILTFEQLDSVLRHPLLRTDELGELLVQLSFCSETDMLQSLAAIFETRYVSSERLSRAKIPPNILSCLPVSMAEQYCVLPVLFEANSSTLSLVTAFPQREDILAYIHSYTKVRELRVYISFSSAIRAAIRKHYHQEPNAFSSLAFINTPPPQARNIFASRPSIPAGEAFERSQKVEAYNPEDSYDEDDFGSDDEHTKVVLRSPSLSSISEVGIESSPVISKLRVVPLLQMFVSRFEQHVPEQQKSLSFKSVWLEAMSQKWSFSATEANELRIAFLLHHYAQLSCVAEDLGKDHYVQSLQSFTWFQWPDHVLSILNQREAENGSSAPSDDSFVSLGRQVLKALDRLVECRKNDPKLALSKFPKQAKLLEDTDRVVWEWLGAVGTLVERQEAGELLQLLVLSEQSKHSDELCQHLRQDDIWLRRAECLDEVKFMIDTSEVDLSIISLGMSETKETFEWLESMSQTAEGHSTQMPEVLLFGSQLSQNDFSQGMELARDVLLVTSNMRMLISQFVRHIKWMQKEKERLNLLKVGALQGQIEHLGLADVLQMLSQSRRSGCLVLTQNEEKGFLFLVEGHVIHANTGLFGGEAAFTKLIQWEKGAFRFDPSGSTPEHTIQKPLESLILDTFRRIDEAHRDGVDLDA